MRAPMRSAMGSGVERRGIDVDGTERAGDYGSSATNYALGITAGGPEMTLAIRGSDWVLVHVPNSPHPPARMQLVAVHEALRSGRLPGLTMLQTTGPDWLPATEVVAACIDFRPTRAHLTIAVLGLIPVLLFTFHALGFGTAGLGPLAVLAVLGIGGAVVVGLMNPLRTRTPRQLVPAVIALAVTVVGAEAFALPAGFKASGARTRIHAALIAGDPCAVRTVKAEVDEFGSEEDKTKVATKDGACSTERAQQLCVRVGAALSDGPPLKDDDLTELGASSSSDSAGPGRLIKRIVDGKVSAKDLQFAGKVTCGTQVVDGLARKLARTPALWSEQPLAVSETMLAAFKQTELTPESKAALRATSESAAKPALTKPLVTGLEPARELCTLVGTLHAEAGPNCTAYEKKYATAKANADAVAKREGAKQAAQERAKDERCAAMETARNKCFADHCLNLDSDDPRNESCNERCEARFSAPGCD